MRVYKFTLKGLKDNMYMKHTVDPKRHDWVILSLKGYRLLRINSNNLLNRGEKFIYLEKDSMLGHNKECAASYVKDCTEVLKWK